MIKVGICLGVGLLIALESLTEIGLVRSGERTVLDIGEFNAEIYIAMAAFVVIGIALHYRVRGAFLIGLVLGTVLYWAFQVVDGEGEVHVSSSDVFVGMSDLTMSFASFTLDNASRSLVYRLVFDLYVIGVILLNGLAHGLSEMAGIKREDGTLPRGKWLYAACGIGTLLSSLLGSGPIMISPESAPGIKSGARTGLSAVVCGMLFLLSTVLCPLFAKVPASGTSPVLLMIGMMLFENAGKVNWSSVKEALPVFLMSVFIPFTYSIFNGVLFGFGIYAVLYLCTEHNAYLRITKQCRKYLSCCCGSSEGDAAAKSRTSGREYSGLSSAHSALHEEQQDLRDLSFELNEISNQFVEPDDDLVSIRLSGLSAAAPSSRSSSTSSHTSSHHSAAAVQQASKGSQPAPTKVAQPFGSYLQSIYNLGGAAKSNAAPDESGYRTVNAGAGSLFSMLGSGRDSNNTPDWVLESSSKL